MHLQMERQAKVFGQHGGEIRNADATIAAFDAFAEANGADFTYEYNSYDAYWETLATQSVGNNLPGIVQQVTDQYAGYINNGLY